MKVISWNCRGLGSKMKEEAMKALIMTENPDIMLVQETKLEENLFLQSSKRYWNKGGTKAISARGASGGLGTLWNASKYIMVAGKKKCTLVVHKVSTPRLEGGIQPFQCLCSGKCRGK
jgi:exonuclease III